MADLYRYQRPATLAASTPAYAAAEIKVRRWTLGRRVGAASMRLFLIAQFFSLARQFFITNLGEELAPLATAAGIGSAVFLVSAVIGYGHYTGKLTGYLIRPARAWLVGLLLLTFLLVMIGLMAYGYAINPIMQDWVPYLILITCVALGSIPEFWQDIDHTILVLFFIGVVINVLGFRSLNDLLVQFGFSTRVGVEVVAYDTQAVMDLWPLLLLTSHLRRRWTQLLIYMGAIFALVQQILFQKRLGTAEVVLFFTMFLLIMPRFARNWPPQWRVFDRGSERRLFLGLLMLAIFVAVLALPQVIGSQANALIERYGETDTARVDEAAGMIMYLSGFEYLLGRGMGGYFQYADSRIGDWGVYLNDVNVVGRRQMHIGALMPMLKGGIVLMLIYYAGLLMVFRQWRSSTLDPLSLTALLIVLELTVHSLQGGMFIMSSSYNMLMLGAFIGRCLAEPEHRQVWIGSMKSEIEA